MTVGSCVGAYPGSLGKFYEAMPALQSQKDGPLNQFYYNETEEATQNSNPPPINHDYLLNSTLHLFSHLKSDAYHGVLGFG